MHCSSEFKDYFLKYFTVNVKPVPLKEEPSNRDSYVPLSKLGSFNSLHLGMFFKVKLKI